MVNFIKFLLGILIIVFRCYLIYCVAETLIKFSNSKHLALEEAGWYLTAIILDMYFISLDNNIGSYIYNKKTDGQKTSE